MPRVGNCDVGIEVDGQRLEEYGTQIDGKTATTWIESEAGKHFAIGLKVDVIESAMRMAIFLDGVFTLALACSQIDKSTKCSHVPISSRSRRPFLFSVLSVTDDENMASPLADLKDLGSVKVVLHRGSIKTAPALTHGNFTNAIAEDSLVHERAKKIGSHRVSLGKEENDPFRQWVTFTPCPEYPDPIAEFTFLYRPRPFLQAQGIIPVDPTPPSTSPTPPHAGSSRHVTENVKIEEKPSEDELAEAMDREEAIRALREEERAIKRRLADLEASVRPLNRIKREIKPDPEWASYTIKDGVIDLTAD